MRSNFCNFISDFIVLLIIDSNDCITSFQLDNLKDTNTTTLHNNMDNIGLSQLIRDPTHIAGHTLDPIFP